MKSTLERSLLTAAAGLLLASAVAACAGQSSPGIPNASHTIGSSARHRVGVPRPAPTATEFTTGITPGSTPRGITPSFGGNMFFTQPGSNQIGRINKNGVVQELAAPTGTVNNIVLGPDGNFWFTQTGTDTIGRMTPKGKIKQFTVGNEAYGPFDICDGTDGNVWFTFRSPSTNAIGRITPSGAVTLFTNGLSGGDIAVHDITLGPDGNVWFTEYYANQIGSITPSGTITEYSAGISTNAGVSDITAGPDGALWFSENSLDQIGRITTGGAVSEFSGMSPGAGPGSIATANGYVWFTEQNFSQVGRVSTSGSITEFPIPAVRASDIATATNGNLWITDYTGNGIVRVKP